MLTIAVVKAWLAAVNAVDAGSLQGWSDARIAIRGPRGVAYGHAILNEWLQLKKFSEGWKWGIPGASRG